MGGRAPTALGNDQRDIVLLSAGAELADLLNNRGQQDLGRQFTMSAKGLSQKGFSKLLSFTVGRFCYAVCVKGESVSVRDLTFFDRTIPILEESQQGRRGSEPFDSVVAPQEKRGKMCEEEGSVVVGGGVL